MTRRRFTPPRPAPSRAAVEAAPKLVTSLQNPLVKDIRALAMRKTREEAGLFVTEGLKLVADAIDGGWPIRVLVHRQGEDKPRQIMLRADKGLDYGRVMRVMGELNRAGLTRISLVTTGAEGAAEAAPTAETAVTDGSETGQ